MLIQVYWQVYVQYAKFLRNEDDFVPLDMLYQIPNPSETHS